MTWKENLDKSMVSHIISVNIADILSKSDTFYVTQWFTRNKKKYSLKLILYFYDLFSIDVTFHLIFYYRKPIFLSHKNSIFDKDGCYGLNVFSPQIQTLKPLPLA